MILETVATMSPIVGCKLDLFLRSSFRLQETLLSELGSDLCSLEVFYAPKHLVAKTNQEWEHSGVQLLAERKKV